MNKYVTYSKTPGYLVLWPLHPMYPEQENHSHTLENFAYHLIIISSM